MTIICKRTWYRFHGHCWKQFRRELEELFVNYHKLSAEQYSVIGVKGPAQARKCIEKGRRAVRGK